MDWLTPIGFLTQLTFLRIWIRVLQGQWKGRPQNEYQPPCWKIAFLTRSIRDLWEDSFTHARGAGYA